MKSTPLHRYLSLKFGAVAVPVPAPAGAWLQAANLSKHFKVYTDYARTMDLVSEPGRGTNFTIRLPLEKADL